VTQPETTLLRALVKMWSCRVALGVSTLWPISAVNSDAPLMRAADVPPVITPYPVQYGNVVLKPLAPPNLPPVVDQMVGPKTNLQPSITGDTVTNEAATRATPGDGTITGGTVPNEAAATATPGDYPITGGAATNEAAARAAPGYVPASQAGNVIVTTPREESSDSAHIWNLFHVLTFAAIVKTLCMIGNIIVQLSPYPQVKRWEFRGSTGEADAAPYVSIMFGGWQWCFYGMFAWILTKRSGFLILVHSNCLGAALGTYYTITFYRFCCSEPALRNLYQYTAAIASLAVFQATALVTLPAERALFLCGLVSSFCSFVGAMSVLVTVPAVLRTKNSRSIPGPLVLSAFGCSLVWCVCGWMLADPLVLCPNVASTLASLVCIILKLRYPSDDKGDGGCESSMESSPHSLGRHSNQLVSRQKNNRAGQSSENAPLMSTIGRCFQQYDGASQCDKQEEDETPEFDDIDSQEYDMTGAQKQRITDTHDGTGGTW